MKSVLLIFLIFMSGCSVVQKAGELMGDKELVKASAEMTPRQEYFLGRSIAAKILSERKISDNKKLSLYIQQLGIYLALHSDRPETYRGYQFVVIESDNPSAMSAPGGYVFVSSAMIKSATNEDELAAVLAHEISHISLKHAQNAIQSKNMWKSVSKWGAVLLSAASGGELDVDSGEAFANIVGGLADLKYNKDQEISADLKALAILHRAGFDSSSLLAVLKRMKSDAEFLSRHPSNDERLRKITNRLDQYPFNGNMEARTKRFLSVR